jgi:hypothetical protein
MTIRASIALAAASLSLLVGATAGSGATFTGFRTPSGNITCLAGTGASAFLRCDIRSGLNPEPRTTCELDWTGLTMVPGRRPRPTCAGDTVAFPRRPVLAYGRSWQRGSFRCTSRRTALTCRTTNGHGFELARARWRTW